MDNFYQEEPDSTVTHNDNEYNLNKLFQLTHNKPIQYLNVDKLKWILKYSDNDIERINKADYKYPLLVTVENGEYIVLDGLHRLQKGINDGIKELPVIFVNKDELEQSLVSISDIINQINLKIKILF